MAAACSPKTGTRRIIRGQEHRRIRDGSRRETNLTPPRPSAVIGLAARKPVGGKEFAFAGELIDMRYDKVANITHCTYRTPLRDFTLEIDGNSPCEPTHPYPYTF